MKGMELLVAGKRLQPFRTGAETRGCLDINHDGIVRLRHRGGLRISACVDNFVLCAVYCSRIPAAAGEDLSSGPLRCEGLQIAG
jgi:hypothetical protein